MNAWWLGPAFAFLAPCMPAAAQSAPVQWTAVSRIERGGCNAGAVAEAREQPAGLVLRFPTRKMKVVSLTVALAPDGSGSAEFKSKVGSRYANLGHIVSRGKKSEVDVSTGDLGKIVVHVAPGAGKRKFFTREKHGDCSWIWEPG
jgi:hypothetical protein